MQILVETPGTTNKIIIIFSFVLGTTQIHPDPLRESNFVGDIVEER